MKCTLFVLLLLAAPAQAGLTNLSDVTVRDLPVDLDTSTAAIDWKIGPITWHEENIPTEGTPLPPLRHAHGRQCGRERAPVERD